MKSSPIVSTTKKTTSQQPARSRVVGVRQDAHDGDQRERQPPTISAPVDHLGHRRRLACLLAEAASNRPPANGVSRKMMQRVQRLEPGQRDLPAAGDMPVDAGVGPQRDGVAVLLVGAAEDDHHRHDAQQQQEPPATRPAVERSATRRSARGPSAGQVARRPPDRSTRPITMPTPAAAKPQCQPKSSPSVPQTNGARNAPRFMPT